MLLLLAGCGEEATAPERTPDPEELPIPTQLTDPAEVASSLALAWSRKDHVALEALLAPDFRYVMLPEHVDDVWWFDANLWGNVEETGIALNMFDPAWTGWVPPVKSIDFTLTILDVVETEPGVFTITATAVIAVVTGSSDGFALDARFVITVRKQPDGFLRVQTMQETAVPAPIADPEPPDFSISWGLVKAQYSK